MIDGGRNNDGSMWALYAGAMAIVLGGAALGLAWALAELRGLL